MFAGDPCRVGTAGSVRPSIMLLSLSVAVPSWRLACLRGCGLAALPHASKLQRPAALGPVQKQAPRAAAGSSFGQPGSEAEGRQAASLPLQPDSREQQEQQWQQAYSQVLAFQQAHSRLPGTDASKAVPLVEGERELGMWCALQRRRKDGSKGTPLSPAQQAALQAIPGWEWGRVRPTRKDWWQWLREVEAFVAQHERLPRPTCRESHPLLLGERQLGRWCYNQRQRWKGQKQPSLSPVQEAALVAIPGWFWELWQHQDWEQQRQRVVAFQQQHSRLPRCHASSSRPFAENEKQLGSWCDSQRRRYKGQAQPSLPPEQEAALRTIPGWYWEQFKQQDWEQQRQRVVAFRQQHGKLPRTKGSRSQPLEEIEQQLGLWCSRQRRRYKGAQQPPLSTEQQAAMAAIPGWYWERYKQQK